jgi:hypothetical protein
MIKNKLNKICVKIVDLKSAVLSSTHSVKYGVRVMCLTPLSTIFLLSVLLVEETRVLGENY